MNTWFDESIKKLHWYYVKTKGGDQLTLQINFHTLTLLNNLIESLH